MLGNLLIIEVAVNFEKKKLSAIEYQLDSQVVERSRKEVGRIQYFCSTCMR
jgi:hypothetical protein